MHKPEAILALEDGTFFRGPSVGAEGESYGELVFNTAITGYQEVLTDPSYKGQLVVMTYPLIGNYGVNPNDMEASRPFLEGFIMRESSRIPSSFRSTLPLSDYLKQHRVLAIEGVDTRALTKKIRSQGALKAVLSTEEKDPHVLVDKAKASAGLQGQDLAAAVSCKAPYTWQEEFGDFLPEQVAPQGPRYPIVAMDFGVKRNILRNLVGAGFEVTVVPAYTNAQQIMDYKPAGVFLSNGPGDPAALHYAVTTAKSLLHRVPIMGICLGHQILAQAIGAKTHKMKFGHHGANQPVKDLTTGKVEITSQNHSFAVEIAAHKIPEVEVTHINLNDQTNEGLRHRELPMFSVQYHPEAAPGPHDSIYLFRRFRTFIENFNG